MAVHSAMYNEKGKASKGEKRGEESDRINRINGIALRGVKH
jgi:hypothetical protein